MVVVVVVIILVVEVIVASSSVGFSSVVTVFEMPSLFIWIRRTIHFNLVDQSYFQSYFVTILLTRIIKRFPSKDVI